MDAFPPDPLADAMHTLYVWREYDGPKPPTNWLSREAHSGKHINTQAEVVPHQRSTVAKRRALYRHMLSNGRPT